MQFAHTLTIAARSLWKSPGFVLTAVLSLSLGIGASAAAFSVIDSVRFRALPFKDADRLVVLSEVPVGDLPASRKASTDCRANCTVYYETFANLLRTHPFNTMDLVTGYTSGLKALNTGEEPILVQGEVIPENLFDLLGVHPLLGRGISAEDNRLGTAPVVVLSHDLWTKHFGRSPSVLGQTVKLSDTRYTIIGVMPPGFDHETGTQFWIPTVPTLDPSTRPSIRALTVLGRLRVGHTVDQLNAELATLDPRAMAAASAEGTKTQLRLEAAPLRSRYIASTNQHDLILGAIVACILLIACANLANLVLVRALHQQREFAVRAALGAGSRRLVNDLMAQHALLVGVATLVGLAFASLFLNTLHSVEVMRSLRPTGMEYRLDARVITFTILLASAALALLSLAPSRLVAHSGVQQLLRDGAQAVSGGYQGSRAQRGFVVAQIAVATVLTVGAALLAKTVLRLSRLDLGFAAGQLVQGTPSYPHPWRVPEKYVPVTRQLRTDFAQLAGVAAVAIRADIPLPPLGGGSALTLQGRAEPLPRNIAAPAASSVSPGYFATLGIAVVKGREFTDRDAEQGLPVAIVNEWAARRWWPGQDAIGQLIRVDSAAGQGKTWTVIGVVHDNKAAQPNLMLAQDGPELYRPYEQAPSAFPIFYLRSVAPTALLRPARDLLVRSVPDRPVFSQLVSEQADTQLGGVKSNALQVIGFALVGLALALIGIYGVLTYTVGRRTQEIGIRGALGASQGTIARSVLFDAMLLLGIGLAIGLPLGALATHIIEGTLYGTSPTDPMVYLLVSIGIAVVGTFASYLPARRASRVDPIIALRSS